LWYVVQIKDGLMTTKYVRFIDALRGYAVLLVINLSHRGNVVFPIAYH